MRQKHPTAPSRKPALDGSWRGKTGLDARAAKEAGIFAGERFFAIKERFPVPSWKAAPDGLCAKPV